MKKIKPVLQSDLKDCGVCCMQWLIKYYDGYISLEKLREDTFTDINGTTAYHIIQTFNKWGFDASGVFEHDITSRNLKFPLIAHLLLENGLEHFVIVEKVYNNTIYLMDPSIGYSKITISKFNKQFTGNIILAVPRGKIIKLDKGTTIYELFLRIIKEEKSLVFKIIVCSLIWTLLVILCSYYLKVGSNLINQNIEFLKHLILIFLILNILKVFTLYVREYYENHLSNLVDTKIYPEFLRHLFFLPLKNVKSRTTGEIVTRVNELANIKSLFSDIFVSCFVDILMANVSILILFFINKNLFLILIVFIFIYLINGFIFSKLMYKRVLKNIDYQTHFNSTLIEYIDMFESLKNLNIIDIILNKIENTLSKSLFNNYEFTNFINISNLFKDFILEMCFFVINSYGFWCVYKGNMLLVDLFTFNILLSYCIEPVKNIIELLPKYNYIKATFSKISEFINIEEEKLLKITGELKGDIIFKNVSYSYNNYNKLFSNININIKQGTHVLLNGPSGSGKSTICKIIYKENFYNNGDVFIGNYNLKDIDVSLVRNNILYISQNEELFTGTIKENILIDRNIDDKLFFEICKICKIDEIVSKKTLRYDSLIEPSSKNISGGEKQRIILARGLLKQANIIILDEALSEVDFVLEKKLINNIREFLKSKTLIYISHKNQTKSFKNIINIGEIK